jgi:hypothetical protein
MPNHAAYLAMLAPIGAEIARALNAHDATLQLPLVNDAYSALKTRIEADVAIAEETRIATADATADAQAPAVARKRLIVEVYDSDSDTEDEKRRATGTSMTPFMQLLRRRDKAIAALEYKCIRLESRIEHLRMENEALNEILDMPTGGTPEPRSD